MADDNDNMQKAFNWQKFALTCVAMLVLVGLAVAAGWLPGIHDLYSQVSASLLGVLGVHHGHHLLSQRLSSLSSGDDDSDDATPADPAPAAPSQDDTKLPPVATPRIVEHPVAAEAPKAATPASPLTAEVLATVMPEAGAERCRVHAPAAAAACRRWGVDANVERLAMFLGNCALECDQLRHLEEEWVPTQAQLDYEPPHHVAAILGNTEPGDGHRFMGRGVIQLTGRSNYRQAGLAVGHPLEDVPPMATRPDVAWDVAAWFWAHHGLNAIADAGDFQKTVRIINGGLTDLKDRQTFYARARRALGSSSSS